MNQAAQEELFENAESLAYDAIKFSPLRHSLSGAEWDAKSEAWAKEIMNKLDELIVSEFEEQEARCRGSSDHSQATHAITSATLTPDGNDLARMI